MIPYSEAIHLVRHESCSVCFVLSQLMCCSVCFVLSQLMC